MKRRLLYVLWCGWILTIPPPTTDSKLTDLQMGNWIQVGAFDTAGECEKARVKSYIGAAQGKSPEWVRIAYVAAQCRPVCKCEDSKKE